ncbi:hypothetical protein [uncultured Thiodictyon sp.]|uniref:hypothetical protein n=1 Tax=uncultured Thiodictyon sp. TaxID=1846217 RepID=UPI0025ECF12F|nr:hypothetical protein [uncultured Thiodictyon sp.]
MKLSPRSFDGLLGGLGQRLTWRASTACPCASPHSGAASPSCTHCDGKGRLWGDPQESLAGIVSREIVKLYAPMMMLDAGDVMLVIPADQSVYALGGFDRVVLTDRTEPFSLLVIPGLNDVLRFAPVCIDEVTWIGTAGELVHGPIPLVYNRGALHWAGASPPAGVTFALTGRRHPEYFCYLALPLDRPHHQGETLPRRVVLRRFDLFGS